MASYNKVLLMGNITRDIEVRYTPSNQAVTTVGLAMNRRYKTKEGEQREETTFVDCEAWGRTAEVMKQYLGKGRPVFIEGRLKLDTWEDQEGQKRSKLKVVVESFEFVDSRGGEGGGGSGEGRGMGGRSEPLAQTVAGAGTGAGTGAGGEHEPMREEEIPF